MFLISTLYSANSANTVTNSPQSAIVQHSILHLLLPYLKFQLHLIDLSQCDIHILYGLQLDFRPFFILEQVHGPWSDILLSSTLLIPIYQKW